ncbi:hypothetical protein HY971_02680 [Candidatus Kaiserbacteria bacterium]|nr:hypothetical protein [Candidatus Kaiserbacteria bacterium]
MVENSNFFEDQEKRAAARAALVARRKAGREVGLQAALNNIHTVGEEVRKGLTDSTGAAQEETERANTQSRERIAAIAKELDEKLKRRREESEL